MSTLRRGTIAVSAAAALVVACDAGPAPSTVSGPLLSSGTGTEIPYVVLAANDMLMSRVEQALGDAGATVTGRIPEIRVILATSADPGFADLQIPGVVGTVPDIQVLGFDPGMAADEAVDQAMADPPNTGDNDPFLNFQWGHAAIDAFDAWDAGYRGAGVRVAVLDAGIDAEHPDLAPNLNAGLSRSFVPGEDWNVQPGFYFNHGTHVSGTIAAADNGFGIIGVAPQAELVAVKVLSEVTGSGSFSGIINGMVYAGSIGADVINMSLRGYVPLGGFQGEPGDSRFYASFVAAFNRAAAFAAGRGATIVVAAGNEALDWQDYRSLRILPSDIPHVIAVSATSPVGWGVNPATNLDAPASYTNYGQSLVDLAGPGGDFAYQPRSQVCVVAGLARACYVFDGVFSTISQGWGWASGTSMATPHVSGVAALVIGKNGGSMHPSQVRAVLTQTADDLGKAGNDEFYGAGRVNAGRAVQ